MFGYSNYDLYFGTNNVRPYLGGGMIGGPVAMPTRMDRLPGINAPKKNENKELKQLAGITAGIAAVILLFKGKGKISNVIKKIFPKKAVAETTETIAKPKFLEKAKGVVTGAVDKVKGLFVKKQKVAAETTQTIVSEAGDTLTKTAAKPAVKETVEKITEEAPKVQEEIVKKVSSPLEKFVPKKIQSNPAEPLKLVDLDKIVGNNTELKNAWVSKFEEAVKLQRESGKKFYIRTIENFATDSKISIEDAIKAIQENPSGLICKIS